MFRRTVVCLLLSVFLLSVAEAQQPKKVPRIGFVSGSGEPSNPRHELPDIVAQR